MQWNDYYPFGMPFADGYGQETQRYKFGGKEFDTMHGLNQYDFHARQYDPATLQFKTPDPKAELAYSWSLYVYCKNNPMRYVDPDGMREWPINETYNGHKRRHSNNFGEQRGNRTHQGLDINMGAGYDDYGAPVYATHEGKVTRIAKIEDGDTNGGGTRIQITSVGGEVSTYYMHLESITEGLEVDSPISEGTQIGTLGASAFGKPNGSASHLHYELRVNGNLTNPALSSTNLVDPQQLITPNVLPMVTVSAPAPLRPTVSSPLLSVPEIKTPQIDSNTLIKL